MISPCHLLTLSSLTAYNSQMGQTTHPRIFIIGGGYLITLGGLGRLVGELAERYDLAATYAAVCFVVIISILFFIVVEKAEKWLRISV